ncbi:MAG: SGNH/GDSL hydrolase family protein [Chitinophagaceae bacterium]
MKLFLLGSCLFMSIFTFGQKKTKRVLFLGNSFTYVNDLPAMIAEMAKSTGDSLSYDSNLPGGHSIGNHSLNAVSIDKIKLGNWDFVVLQGQSYELATETPEVYPFPYARKLDSLINLYNDCTETVFYMTWGLKNGDPSSCPTVPFLCTYEKMDSIIHSNYRRMSDSNDAIVSPVGAVWRSIRKTNPLIELYQADESHPSLAGTYAAACCFYASLYRKNPALITYNPGLPSADATIIRNVAKLVVYDSLLHWHIGAYDDVIKPGCIPTGIDNIDEPLTLSLSPNPVSDILQINCSNQTKKETLQVFNCLGSVIMELEISGNALLNVQELNNGVYFLRFKNNDTEVYKFLKN